MINRWHRASLMAVVALVIAQPARAVVESASTTVGLTPIAQADPIKITNVQIAETTVGLTLQLATNGELETPKTSITGNAVIANIANAVLQLPDEFLVSNPADGIALVNVTNLPNNQVQIIITGTDAPPEIDTVAEPPGLIVNAVPTDLTDQSPDSDSLRIVVTGEQEGYLVPSGLNSLTIGLGIS